MFSAIRLKNPSSSTGCPLSSPSSVTASGGFSSGLRCSRLCLIRPGEDADTDQDNEAAEQLQRNGCFP